MQLIHPAHFILIPSSQINLDFMVYRAVKPLTDSRYWYEPVEAMTAEEVGQMMGGN